MATATATKERNMISKGDVVYITPGTPVLVSDGETTHEDGPLAGYLAYDRIVSGEWDAESLPTVGLVVDHVGVSHATMNGGGRDYQLTCPYSGFKLKVRTTLQRPESACFSSTPIEL